MMICSGQFRKCLNKKKHQKHMQRYMLNKRCLQDENLFCRKNYTYIYIYYENVISLNRYAFPALVEFSLKEKDIILRRKGVGTGCIQCIGFIVCIGCIGCIESVECIRCIEYIGCTRCVGCIGCIECIECIR